MTIESFPVSDPRFDFHHELRSATMPTPKRCPAPDHGRGYVLMREKKPCAFLVSFSADCMLNTESNTAIVGFYEARCARDGHELLAHVADELRTVGKTSLIGPMNQNTWGQYRFALPSTNNIEFASPIFFGDVIHHEQYPQHFIDFGFTPISHYESRATFDLAIRHPRRQNIENTLKEHGIVIEPIDMSLFDQTLKTIFALSLMGFSRNKFYAPISYSYFASLYKGIESIIDPDLFLLAKNSKQEIVGFIFSYKDPYAAEDRVILKSMTIDDSVRGLGLGLFLMDEIQRIAHEKNFTCAIHALMYVDNTTKGISEGGMSSRLFKRYALFQKPLT